MINGAPTYLRGRNSRRVSPGLDVLRHEHVERLRRHEAGELAASQRVHLTRQLLHEVLVLIQINVSVHSHGSLAVLMHVLTTITSLKILKKIEDSLTRKHLLFHYSKKKLITF